MVLQPVSRSDHGTPEQRPCAVAVRSGASTCPCTSLPAFLCLLSASQVIHRSLEAVLSHVQLDDDFLLALELHDKERIPRLALSKRRVQTDGDQSVQIVGLWQKHKFLDMLVLDFVVVGFTTQPERILVHVDIKSSSAIVSAHQRHGDVF